MRCESLKPLKQCLIDKVAEELLASEEELYWMDLSVFRFILFKGDISFCDRSKNTEGSSGGLIGHTCWGSEIIILKCMRF